VPFDFSRAWHSAILFEFQTRFPHKRALAMDADHTGTLSLQLSPAVTFDNPCGFLTETNEPEVAAPK
jgi:hypothetical protein